MTISDALRKLIKDRGGVPKGHDIASLIKGLPGGSTDDSILVPEQTKGYNADLSFVIEGDGSSPSEKLFVYGPFEGTLGDVGDNVFVTGVMKDGDTDVFGVDGVIATVEDGSRQEELVCSRMVLYEDEESGAIAAIIEDLNETPGVVFCTQYNNPTPEVDAFYASLTATIEVNKAEEENNGTGGVLVVNAINDQELYTLDKTWKEIRDAEAVIIKTVVTDSAGYYQSNAELVVAVYGAPNNYRVETSSQTYFTDSEDGYPYFNNRD